MGGGSPEVFGEAGFDFLWWQYRLSKIWGPPSQVPAFWGTPCLWPAWSSQVLSYSHMTVEFNLTFSEDKAHILDVIQQTNAVQQVTSFYFNHFTFILDSRVLQMYLQCCMIYSQIHLLSFFLYCMTCQILSDSTSLYIRELHTDRAEILQSDTDTLLTLYIKQTAGQRANNDVLQSC